MQQWIEIASKNGLAVLVIFALGFFFYKKLWPLIEKRIAEAETNQKENLRLWKEQGEMFTAALKHEREANERRFEEQGKMFADTIRSQNVLAAETHRESMKAQGEMIREMKTLNQRLKNGNGK